MKSILIILALIISSSSFATTHLIKFGGTVGMMYSPDSVNAQVGDTIRWEGDFSFHPLVSLSVPSGASPLVISTGTFFLLTQLKPGDYRYHCDVHLFKGVIKVANSNSIFRTSIKAVSMFYNATDKCLQFSEIKNATYFILDNTGKEVCRGVASSRINLPLITPGYYTACLFKENEPLEYLKFFIPY
jgi:plastocyanin